MYVLICLYVGICLYICVYEWRHVIAYIDAYVYKYKSNHSSMIIHAEDWGRANLCNSLNSYLAKLISEKYPWWPISSQKRNSDGQFLLEF